jgi:hypothetical protein
MTAELYNTTNIEAGIARFDSSEFTVLPEKTYFDGREIYPCVLTDGTSEIAFTDDAYGQLFAASRTVIHARCTADYGKA